MAGASAAGPLWSGTVLGGFRLLEQLGADGLGELYRAQSTHAAGLLRALRVIRADLLAQPDFRPQLIQIVELFAGVAHPNLLRLYHLGETQEHVYIVQELLTGQTLRALTTAQPGMRSVSLVVDWIYQALCGLGHAHRHGIVHQGL